MARDLVQPTTGPRWRALGLALAVGLGLAGAASAQEPTGFAARWLCWPVEAEPEAAAGPRTEVDEREEFLETDRNSFTFAPFTPGAGRTMVEAAYSYLNFGGEGSKHSFPEFVLRHGIGDRLELRLGYNYETGSASEVGEGNIAGNFGIDAEQQLLYGFKYATTRQGGAFRLMPHSAFLAQAHTPIGSTERPTQMRLGYVWGWILRNGWTFDQAIRFGTDREGHDGFQVWAPSAVVRIPLGAEKRWFTHFEYFGLMSQAKEHEFSKQFVDTGLHYFITPDFEVGGIVGFGINDQSRGTIVNVGFGFRF